MMFTPSGHLYRIDQVPVHFRELFIVSGYRHPRSTPKQCVRSIFEANNEAVNFWTHFLPALYYWYIGYTLWQELDVEKDAYAWPMIIYLVCVCLFPITSATAHIFNTMSDSARHLCFFADYASLSVYSMGTAMANRAYAFPTGLLGSMFADLYLLIASTTATLCILLSCETRFMPNGMLKKFYRIVAFGLPYIFDSLPLLYRIAFCTPDDCNSQALHLHLRQFILASMSAFFYISHLPERLWPGKFDVVGHSHQIFHVFSALASHDQLNGLMTDMNSRRHLVGAENIPSLATNLSLIGLVVAINMAILAYFTAKLYSHLPSVVETREADQVCSGAEGVCNGVDSTVRENGEPAGDSLRRRDKQSNGKK